MGSSACFAFPSAARLGQILHIRPLQRGEGGLGHGGSLLTEMAGTGDWLEGVRFRSSVDAADVTEWVDGLGLPETTPASDLQN